MSYPLIKQFVLTKDGKTYVFRVFDDHTGCKPPWEEEDGHGPVRHLYAHYGIKGLKHPGERVLHQDGRNYWLYNWQGAARLARTEWGAKDINEAVQADFDYLKSFLQGDWHYVGVGYVEVEADGTFPEENGPYYRNAVWGFESTSDFHEIANELV